MTVKHSDSPLILLDVDGVVADFTDRLLGSIGSEKTIADITSWRIQDHVTPEQWKKADHCLSDWTWWVEQPVMAGAVEGVEALREIGEIHWVTSPWWSCFGWESARRDWLHRCFGAKYNEITFTYRKDLVSGDVLIDDKPEHVEAWAKEQTGLGLLFDAPYNKEPPLIRVNWPSIPGVVGAWSKGESI